ncbi:MAG: DUF3488 and transglutaminase-like domain-containing protein [Planctomycetaceae bacterium]
MQRIRDPFTISLYAVACAASLMLAAAEGGWYLPAALTLPIAIAAYAFVERRDRRLSTVAANCLGLVAIAAALLELFVRDIEGRILFGAHLLVYLSWVLLWQPKGPQQRWGLIALAILQIAVGSVLTSAGLYGMAMVAFVVLAVWTLVLLQLTEAESRLARGSTPPAASETGPKQLLASGRVSAIGPVTLGEWSTRQILAVVNITVLAAIAVSATFFLLIPRVDVGRHGFHETDTPLARQRVTGFTERVRLGEFGEILESSIPVFEVRLYDGDDPVDIETYTTTLGFDEPLFRGLTLHHYENGEWTTGDSGWARELPDEPFTEQIRQEYRLKSHTSDVLFAIAPVDAGRVVGSDSAIRRRSDTDTILRPTGRRHRGELHYEVFSPRQGRYAEVRRGAASRGRRDDESDRFEEYLELPDGLDRLRRLATDIARREGPDETDVARAERLLTWLRDSGTFRYSLSGELIDPQIDPVEDFLVNRRAGHCEYFASALALMLRAEGIPSRVVNGFKGGEVNRFDDGFEVQQRHAHAWVEARLGGRWVTFDPTPASGRSQSVAENAPKVPLWNDIRSAASTIWYQYVLQLDLSRQQRTFAPLQDAAVASTRSLRTEWWPILKRQAYALATDPSRWISWQGGVATFLGLSLVTVLWRVGRRLRLRLARFHAARAAHRRRGRRIEFYERFRRLCERRGWLADDGQTPREFAAEVTVALAGDLLPARLAELPGELTEDFYQVRFGNRDLSESRLSELGLRLAELEATLADAAPIGGQVAQPLTKVARMPR